MNVIRITAALAAGLALAACSTPAPQRAALPPSARPAIASHDPAYGCQTVTTQLFRLADRVKNNSDPIDDMAYLAVTELQLRKDAQDPRTPAALARAEIKLAADMGKMAAAAVMTADLDAIRSLCPRAATSTPAPTAASSPRS